MQRSMPQPSGRALLSRCAPRMARTAPSARSHLLPTDGRRWRTHRSQPARTPVSLGRVQGDALLTATELKPHLLHEDRLVRDAVVEYFKDSWSPDPDLVPIVLEAVRRYGSGESRAQSSTMTRPSLRNRFSFSIRGSARRGGWRSCSRPAPIGCPGLLHREHPQELDGSGRPHPPPHRNTELLQHIESAASSSYSRQENLTSSCITAS